MGGAAKRYYHGEVAEKANHSSFSDSDFVVPKRLREDRIVVGHSTERNGGGDGGHIFLQDSNDSLKEQENHGPMPMIMKEGQNILSNSAPSDKFSDTPTSTLQYQAEQDNDKLKSQPTISDRSDLVLVPVVSEISYTPEARDTALDSHGFSAEELWPNIPEDSSHLEDNNSQLPDRAGASIIDSLPLVQSALDKGTMSKEIHILGVGVLGKFIAHGLAGLPQPPAITLLMQRPLLMQQWHDEGAAITLFKEGRFHTRTGFNIESAANFKREKPNQRFAAFGKNLEHSAEPPTTVIDTLVVTTASKVTVPALMAVKHRLRPSSTVCIIQDGMGIIDDLNTLVFPDPQRRPTYVLGSMARSQQLSTSDRTFTIVQKGDVRITCSKLPHKHVTPATESGPSITRLDFSWSLPAAYLVGSLARVPDFYTRTVGHKSFYKSQLGLVAVHSVIGPVSVLHDCTNGQLLSSYNAKLTMRSLLEEISLIIRSLPELKGLPNIEQEFGVKKLEAIVRGILIKTAESSSTMLQNVNAGRRTDIDYYNGYLIARAAELGIDCPRNEMLVNVVKAKQMIKSRAVESYVPFVNE